MGKSINVAENKKYVTSTKSMSFSGIIFKSRTILNFLYYSCIEEFALFDFFLNLSSILFSFSFQKKKTNSKEIIFLPQ